MQAFLFGLRTIVVLRRRVRARTGVIHSLCG